MGSIILHKVLRQCDPTSLQYVGEKDGHELEYQKEVEILKKVLFTPKNLFLFFPYTFEFEKEKTFNNAISSIKNALYSDFSAVLKLRATKNPKYETFFAFVYDDFLVMMEYKNSKFYVVDYVNVIFSKTYQQMEALGI